MIIHFTQDNHFTSHHFTSLHFTSLHFTSLHCTSQRFTPNCPRPFHASKTLHFPSLIITFITLFLKYVNYSGKSVAPLQAVDSTVWIVLCTKEYLWVYAIPEEQRALTNYNPRHRRHNISIPARPHKTRSPNKSSGKGRNHVLW
jgi:hypothetical protein